MGRSLLRSNAHDGAGNVIQNALCNVYLTGTTTPVSDLYAAASGGSPVTTLTSDSHGDVVGWFTTPKVVDINVTDNTQTAYYPSTPGSKLSFAAFTVTVGIPADAGFDTSTFVDSAGDTMTGALSVPDVAYDATAWDGSTAVPTRNAVRDKIEALSATFLPGSTGAGSPEGVVTASTGSEFLRTDGGPGSTLYVKETGTGNTGWFAASSLDPTLPTGALAHTFPRNIQANQNLGLIGGGTLELFAVYLRAGMSIANITFVSGTTAGASMTHQWFSLYSAALAKLKVTSDDTSTAWAANTAKTLAVAGGAYAVPSSGLYYVGILVTATGTLPTLCATANPTVMGLAPILAGNSTASLTDPASAPSTAGALTAIVNLPYAYVS